MRVVLCTGAFTLMLLGLGEALDVTAGYRTSNKSDNGEYLAIVGEPLTMWVRYGLSKKDVKTIKLKKTQNGDFVQEFLYQRNDSNSTGFSDNLRDRASYLFTNDGMEINITSLQMNDNGMYLFLIENSDHGDATFHLREKEIMIMSDKDEVTTKINIGATTTSAKHALPSTVISQGPSTHPGQDQAGDNVSFEDYVKTMFMILMCVMIFILLFMVVVTVIIGIGYFTGKFRNREQYMMESVATYKAGKADKAYQTNEKGAEPLLKEDQNEMITFQTGVLADSIAEKVAEALKTEYSPLLKKGTSHVNDLNYEKSNKHEDEEVKIGTSHVNNLDDEKTSNPEDEEVMIEKRDEGKPE